MFLNDGAPAAVLFRGLRRAKVHHYFPRLNDRHTSQAGLASQLIEEIFEIVQRRNAEQGVSILLAEQNTNVALKFAHYGYTLKNGRVVLDGDAASLRENEDVKEFYLDMAGAGRRTFKDVKRYRRRRRGL